MEGYKFSQFSTGDASISGSNKKFNQDIIKQGSYKSKKEENDNSTGNLSHNTVDLDNGDNTLKSNAMF